MKTTLILSRILFCFTAFRTYAIMGICFGGFTSVVEASPLDTIPPPISDSFVPVNQRSVEPVRNPGDFIGRVFAPKPEDWKTRPEAQPITGVTVTIASGPRTGESVATNPSGYYHFQNVIGDELHLRVEKEHFEPKEVKVHRSGPTILANGDVPNYTKDPQQHPGNILIGHRWPDEVRFILEETLVVHDLLYVEGGRLPKGTDLGGFYSLGVVVLYSYQYADWKDQVGLLGTFAHEIAHAHQHATVSVDGSAWEIHGWGDTPEGRAYEEAERKDWEQVGKSPLDNIYGDRRGRGGVALTETAAETCAHYWSVDRWGGRTAYGLLEVEAPNRYKWAEKWVPITIAVRPPPKVVSIPDVPPPPKVVSIPDTNLAAAVRKALGLSPNVPIPQRAIGNLRELDARKRKIKQLTGLEQATRLRLLELRENQISDIRPLANLKKLQQLILDDNRVSDITPLANMTQLHWLLIGGNPISDFTPLKHLTQLGGLSIWHSNFSDTTLLVNKTKLTHLWLDRNNIRDITPLANLVNLKVLHLRDNSIRDISPLAELTKLEDLKLGGNPIVDKSPLRTLKDGNPGLKVDIEIPPRSPIVHVSTAQRPPLYWIDTATGTLHRIVGDAVENLVPNVQNATGLAIDVAEGKLYWTEKTGNTTGKIQRANLDGNPNVQLVKELTSVPYGIALDTADGKIYVTNSWGKVQRLNVDGSNFQPNLITELENPKDIAVDTVNGKVYWIEAHERSGNIRRANLDGSNVQLVKALTSVPLGIALDVSDGKIYLTNAYGKVQRLNLDGFNFQPNLITGLENPKDIAVDTVNGKVYWTENGSLRRASLQGENIEDVATNLESPATLVLGVPLPSDTTSGTDRQEIATAADVNQDKKVNKADLLLVITALGETPPANANFDVNADGTVNVADVLLVIEALDDSVAAAAPALGETVTSLDPGLLSMHLDILRAESDGSLKYEQAIAFFQGLLASLRPTETQLLANYPNPFNPETWIPYQLAKSGDVTVRIYDVNGGLVRTLALGHQTAGIYQSRSRAAYWDGRNTFGESVASGLYFYTLTAGDFSATRKMLIRK